MAHSLARRSRSSANKSNARLGHLGTDIFSRSFFVRTTNLANQYHRLSLRVVLEHFHHFHKTCTRKRVTANANAGRLSNTRVRHFPHDFVSQGSRSRNHANIASRKNVPRHDAHLAFARSNDARAVATQQSGHAIRSQSIHHPSHVRNRNPLGNQRYERKSRRFALKHRIRSKRRWNKNDRCIRSGRFNRFRNRVKDWLAQELLAALSRGHAAHNLGSIVNHLLSVERTLTAGHTANNHFCIFIDEN